MDIRTLGNDLEVSALGFGCMGISFGYAGTLDRATGVQFIRDAVDRGMTFFDTAEIYGPYVNEELVGEALAPVRDQVKIATKFGFNLIDGKQSGIPLSRAEAVQLERQAGAALHFHLRSLPRRERRPHPHSDRSRPMREAVRRSNGDPEAPWNKVIITHTLALAGMRREERYPLAVAFYDAGSARVWGP